MRDDAGVPAWQVALGGVLVALATFALLWALPILLWALEASAAR
jgi:hypothetical protein